MPTELTIRAARDGDAEAIWRVLEPMIRAGETYPLSRDMTRDATLAYWCKPDQAVFVAEHEGTIVGTYMLRPNQQAGGGHVANCGFVTAPSAQGKGVARAMCVHSFEEAKRRGFRAMQYNFVVATNERAVRLWQSMGMEIVGRLPAAFHHSTLGYVDALVMYRRL